LERCYPVAALSSSTDVGNDRAQILEQAVEVFRAPQMLIQLCQIVQQMSSWTIQTFLLPDLSLRCPLSDPSVPGDTCVQSSYITAISPGLS